jgi:hypothetical protein
VRRISCLLEHQGREFYHPRLFFSVFNTFTMSVKPTYLEAERKCRKSGADNKKDAYPCAGVR